MLSIIVNDALMGVDIMKKYPGFYARMLADAELRTAFLETLELLEMSRNDELPEYTGPPIVNLDFLREPMKAKPVMTRTADDKWQFIWQRPFYHLQKLLNLSNLALTGVYRQDDLMLDENFVNLLHDKVMVGEETVEVRLDVSSAPAEPDKLNMLLFVFAEEERLRGLEATVCWGGYRETAGVNHLGMARFRPLDKAQIFDPSGEMMNGFEFRLMLR